MLLGQVVTSGRFEPLKFFGKVTTLPDNGIPTLVVGKKKAEEIFGKERIKVLNRQISDKIHWTFSKAERRVTYEADVDNFYKDVFKSLSKKIKYNYFNIFTERLSTIKRFISFMEKGPLKYIYLLNDHLYIYSGKDIVVGFSLKDTDYIGIPKEKILNKIKSNPANIIFTDSDFIPSSVKQYLPNANILAPYLYFLDKR